MRVNRAFDMRNEINKLKDRLFSNIHANNLIYNTCWEDPRLDRKLMQFDGDSKVVMITSAGCNALDYTLDTPAEINCIDVNFRQNALLELKKATLAHGSYDDHFLMFGEGAHPEARELYHDALRERLPQYAAAFWDEKIKYFFPRGERTFYFSGTCGSFAWLFKKYFDARRSAKELVLELLNAQSLDEQKALYGRLEPKLLSKMVMWLMNRHFTMALLGVPRPQMDLIVNRYPEGMAGYLRDNLRHIFTELPIADNYFWYLYIMGHYSKSNCPEYLRKAHFDNLKAQLQQLKVHVHSIAGFLKEHPGTYTHYILLDHQDWLAAHDPKALAEEWQLILQNSKPGTKILLRSAALEVNFLPDFVKERVVFHHEAAKSAHKLDRVGTYGSTCLAEVR